MPLILGKKLTRRQLKLLARLIKMLDLDHKQYLQMYDIPDNIKHNAGWFRYQDWFVDNPLDIHAAVSLYPKGKHLLGGLIGNVIVDPLYRRRGLARQLLTLAILASKKAGDLRLGIPYMAENKNAINLYRSLGFMPYLLRAMIIHNKLDKKSE